MKKVISIFIVMLVLSLLFSVTAYASGTPPAGTCPTGFELHEYMDQCKVNMPNHIGVVEDLNGDGYICMLKLSNDLHVHVDNTLTLP